MAKVRIRRQEEDLGWRRSRVPDRSWGRTPIRRQSPRSYPRSSSFQGLRTRAGQGGHGRRLLLQSAVSLAIFLTIVAVFTWPGEGTEKAKAVIREYLVEDYGMTPVFEMVDTVMAWGDALEWDGELPAGQAALGSLPLEAVPPASQVTLPADGRVLPVAAASLSEEESVTARITRGDWPAASPASSAYDTDDRRAGLWIETAAAAPVRAAMAGTVAACGEEEEHQYTLTLAAEDGWSFCYSNLSALSVAAGDRLEQGAILGQAGKSLHNSQGTRESQSLEETTAPNAGGSENGTGNPGALASESKTASGQVCVEVFYQGEAVDPVTFFLGSR